jgi:RNA polymerase sigma-70 factor (ECF subfamily)
MSSDRSPSADVAQRTDEFLRLLGQHEERTNAFVFSLVPNWADAQDIAQDVRLRLWEQFDAYDPTKDFGAWARAIAYYLAMAHRKRLKGAHVQIGQESLELVAATFNDTVEQFEKRGNLLQRCLEKLQAAKRRLLLRCYSGRESIREVAESLGRSYDAVRKTVFRTRQQLTDCVRQELRGEDIEDGDFQDRNIEDRVIEDREPSP